MNKQSHTHPKVIQWLLSGDVSIAYQTKRDLLETGTAELNTLRRRIALEGWGVDFLNNRNMDGLWGHGYYLPKWLSTHYTLLDLKNLGFSPGNKEITESVNLVLQSTKGTDGGISYGRKKSDVCVNGMILNFSAYFLGENIALNNIADFLLHTQMEDGGWNCKYLKGHTHSSLHSTLSVLEGLLEYRLGGNTYRIKEIKKAEKDAIEFLLVHRLYKSHHTGEIIDPKMLLLSYPTRWRYDILRALDYLQQANIAYDSRMEDAITVIESKRKDDGRWNLQAKHTGLIHFEMEKVGEPSRWNTLRALRVLRHFGR